VSAISTRKSIIHIIDESAEYRQGLCGVTRWPIVDEVADRGRLDELVSRGNPDDYRVCGDCAFIAMSNGQLKIQGVPK